METSDLAIDAIVASRPDIPKDQFRILEPSAGQGKLALKLRNTLGCVKIHCCELNDSNASILLSRCFEIVARDFLDYFPKEKYNFIAAVPPYKDNVDCAHIMHMYDNCLDDGGRLASLSLPLWVTGSFTIQRKFRKWLEGKQYKLRLLPDSDDSYLSAPKMLMVIDKPYGAT